MKDLISSILYLEIVAFSVLLLGTLYLCLHTKYPNTYIGYASKSAKRCANSWESANRAYGMTAIANSLAVGGLVVLLSRLEVLTGPVSAIVLTELIFAPILLAELLSARAYKRDEQQANTNQLGGVQ